MFDHLNSLLWLSVVDKQMWIEQMFFNQRFRLFTPFTAIALAPVEAHYSVNNGFLDIWKQLVKLKISF